MRIKILVIVNAIFGYDGISSVATNYYRYQNKNKVQMDFLTINPIPEALKLEIEADGNKSYVISGRNRNPIGYFVKLRKVIANNKYDIVYVHGNSATMLVELLAAKLGKCRVRVAHSHNTQCDHQVLNKILMPLFSLLYTDCCACSAEAGSFLFGDKECYVVNNGLYFPKYEYNEAKREEIRRRYSLKDKIVLGHIGRFTYQKNQEFLITILTKMVAKGIDAVLLLVGTGEMVEQIERKAKENGIRDRVVFYGTTDYVNEVVQAMDCFVFPSRFEGLGIVALEAQAAGLNCVASDQVPKKMKINDGTVFLALDADVNEWINNIEKCIVSTSERTHSRSVERELFKSAGYDIEQNCKDMLEYYYSILNRKG